MSSERDVLLKSVAASQKEVARQEKRLAAMTSKLRAVNEENEEAKQIKQSRLLVSHLFVFPSWTPSVWPGLTRSGQAWPRQAWPGMARPLAWPGLARPGLAKPG